MAGARELPGSCPELPGATAQKVAWRHVHVTGCEAFSARDGKYLKLSVEAGGRRSAEAQERKKTLWLWQKPFGSQVERRGEPKS